MPQQNISTYALKQMFRRYTDGVLVAKDEIYKEFRWYQHVQLDASDTWLVVHNKESTTFVEQIYINGALSLGQADIQIIDSNSFQINFTTAITGIVNIAFMDTPSTTPTP